MAAEQTTTEATEVLVRQSDVDFHDLYSHEEARDEFWLRVGLLIGFVQRMNDDD